MINFHPIVDKQRELMDRIEKEHPATPGENRFEKRVLSLLVEVGECANEWRGFKFWSKDQEPRTKVQIEYCYPVKYKNNLLEEYVDGVHFMLELGILIGYEFPEIEFPEGKGDITKHFLRIYNDISDLRESLPRAPWHQKVCFDCLLDSYIRLGAALGFTWEEIEQAYFQKNQVNHERQDNGY